jgi:hypothetical protein
MGPDIIGPLGFFLTIILVVYFAINGATQKRKAILNTVEEAIRAGQQVTPDMVKALGMPRKNSNADLKGGTILLAVALAFVVLGWAIGTAAGEDEVMYIMPAVATFPGFIGLVLIGFGILGKKNKDEA